MIKEQELNDILEIKDKEMEVIGSLRQVIMEAENTYVMADIVDVDSDRLVVMYDTPQKNKTEFVTINRKTLLWTI